jgi:gluconate 2-dehydrogenase gamma chain
MTGNPRVPRRRFLEVAATSAGAAACGGPKSRWRYFTDAETLTLAAICDQVIPPDQDPGASEAGVVDYIDRQLDGHFRKLRTMYRDGLAGIDALARKQHGRAFVELSSDQRLAMLSAIDSKRLGDAPVREFFQAVVAHTMQGYYGSPRHGGNKKWASWRMLGVPTSPVRGRLQYDLTEKGS